MRIPNAGATVLDEITINVGWKVGLPITNYTYKGTLPVWSTVRQRFWKNEAFFNANNYDASNLSRMQKPGLSNTNILYSHPGSVNVKQGVFEIGTRSSLSGNTGVIIHRFFNPKPR
ncbi:hypothetical protein [Myroides odoratus]|uniref:hypothetical protein n=1 Tax=Myroides odoratus TaxID=256 RepID=UPI0039AFA0E4